MESCSKSFHENSFMPAMVVNSVDLCYSRPLSASLIVGQSRKNSGKQTLLGFAY